MCFYYWLGFDVECFQDGCCCFIELCVDIFKVKVCMCFGYIDLSLCQEVVFLVESVLFFGNVLLMQIVEVEFGQGCDLCWGKVEVFLIVCIFVDQFVFFLVVEGEYVGEVEIWFVVKDGVGNCFEIFVILLCFECSGIENGVVEYMMMFKMCDCFYDLVVVVYELVSGRIFLMLVSVGF